MRIIKTRGEGAARRLAAVMLWAEMGKIAVGDDLSALPEPHLPWPVVPLPAQTEQGQAAEAHYWPTVGIVLYTEPEEFRVAALVDEVAALLRGTDAHLLARAETVVAAPYSVLQRPASVRSETKVVGPHKPRWRAKDRPKIPPTRVLLYVPRDDSAPKLPPYCSVAAAFTWVFMPVASFLYALSREGDGMNRFNALVASVLYDAGEQIRAQDGAEVFDLSAADFAAAPLPQLFKGFRLSVVSGWDDGCALVVKATGDLECVGRGQSFAPQNTVEPVPLPIAVEPLDEDTLCLPGAGVYQCCYCRVPIGGAAVVLRDVVTVAFCDRHYHAPYLPPPGRHLFVGALANRGVLLCSWCWSALGRGCSWHLRARVSTVRLPVTQAESAARLGLWPLAELLSCTARAVPGMLGAFEASNQKGLHLLLTGANLGENPVLQHRRLWALGLPVLSELRIISEDVRY